jgi:hypothetical protein
MMTSKRVGALLVVVRALGLAVPRSLLLRAEQVIE